MQTTIYDFTFLLRKKDELTYLSPTNLTFGTNLFETLRMKDPYKDYGLTLGVSYDYSSVPDGTSPQELYPDAKHRVMPKAICMYPNMFELDNKEDGLYQPKFLLRRVEFPNIIAFRGNDGGSYWEARSIFAIRGFDLVASISTEKIETLRGRIEPRLLPKYIITPAYTIAIPAKRVTVGLSVSGEIKRLRAAVYHRILSRIEKSTPSYFEKIVVPEIRSKSIHLSLIQTEYSFYPLRQKSVLRVSLSTENISAEGLRAKYAIITLNSGMSSILKLRSKRMSIVTRI